MITIPSFLFQSVPEAMVFTAFAIALAGIITWNHIPKIMLSGFIVAIITVVLWFVETPFYLRMFLQLPLIWLVVYFIFRYPFYRVMISVTVSLGVLIIGETISLELVLALTPYTIEDLLASTFLRIAVPSGGYIFLIVPTWLMNQKQWSLFKKDTLEGTVNRRADKKIDLYILALTVQILLVVVYNLSYVNGYFQQSNLLFQIMTFSVIILSILMLFFVRYIISLSEKAGELEAQKEYIKNIDDLFVTIRGQRHDFINHVQVIHSYMQMGKYDRLQEYINCLTQEVKDISKIMIPNNATLSALLQTKSVLYRTYDIDLQINLKGNLANTKMSDLDQVKLLGNLLDNAKEAIIEHNVEAEKRKISLSIKTVNESLYIKIQNLRPVLSEEQLQKIFNVGYTTKENHTGIGLAIVKQLISKYQGELAVSSSEEQGTEFVIKLPILKDVEINESNIQKPSGSHSEELRDSNVS